MAQTAAHLVDHVIPHAPVRQWVLSLPIPPRLLLAAQPKLLTPVLQVVHRVITRHLLGQAGLKPGEADSGAVTLTQRFGSAANLNIHLHCLVLDGVYRAAEKARRHSSKPPRQPKRRCRRCCTRSSWVLIEEEGSTYTADDDGDSDEARVLRPLRAIECAFRVPRAVMLAWLRVGVMFCCVCMARPIMHVVNFGADRGLGTRESAWLQAVMMVCGMLGRIGFGRLADQFGNTRRTWWRQPGRRFSRRRSRWRRRARSCTCCRPRSA